MRTLPVFLLVLLCFSGCYRSIEGVPRSDGGGFPGADAGTVLGPDAGPFPMDSGRLPGTSDGGRFVDAGRFMDAGQFDTGRFVDAGSGVCVDGEVLRYDGPGCAEATRGCLEGCRDGDCQAECISRDRECGVCINEMILSCANSVRCQPLWDQFACCLEPTCPAQGFERLACDLAGCEDVAEVTVDCLNEQIDRCQAALFECF